MWGMLLSDINSIFIARPPSISTFIIYDVDVVI